MIDITWLGHSTFEIRLESGEVLLFDPFVSGNPKYPAGHSFSRVDYICISHGHIDHISDAVSLATRFGATCVSNYEIFLWLLSKGVAKEKCQPMNKGGTIAVGPVSITMTHAFHSSTIEDGDRVIPAGEAGGYVIGLADGRSFYFAGDTALFGDMALIHALYNPSLAFLPIGDRFTMGPKEASVACEMLEIDTVVPMHYQTFGDFIPGDPATLEMLLAGHRTKVWKLEPGKTVKW